MFKECIGCTQKRLDDEPQDDRSHVLCPICRMSRYYKAYKQYITSRMRSKSNLRSTSIERKLRKFITNKFHIITKLYALKQLTSSHKLKEYLQVKNFLLNDRQIKFIFSSKKAISSRLCLREIERLENSNEAQEELLQLEVTSTSSSSSSDTENNEAATEVSDKTGDLADEQLPQDNQDREPNIDTHNKDTSPKVTENDNNEDVVMNDVDNNDKPHLIISQNNEESEAGTNDTPLSANITLENPNTVAIESGTPTVTKPSKSSSSSSSSVPSHDISPSNGDAPIPDQPSSTVKSPTSLLAPDTATAEKPKSQETRFTGHTYKLKPSRIEKPAHNERTNDAQLHSIVQNLQKNLGSINLPIRQSPNTDMNATSIDTRASTPSTTNLPEQEKTPSPVQHSRQATPSESTVQSNSPKTSTLIDNMPLAIDPVIQTSLSPIKRCRHCKQPKPSDMPLECSSYSTCPRCIIKSRLQKNNLQNLSKFMKLYGFYQMTQEYDKHEKLIKLAMEQDSYLADLGSRKFDYPTELAKLRAVVSSQIQPPESQQSANINFNSPVSSPVNSPVISATTSNRRGSTDLEDVETNNGIMILDDRPQRREETPQQEDSSNIVNSPHSENSPIQEDIVNQENASIQEDSYHQNENQSDQHNGTDKNTSSNENIDIVDEVVNTVEKHAEGDIKIEKNARENDTGHSNENNPEISDEQKESGNIIGGSNNNENVDINIDIDTNDNSPQINVEAPKENTNNRINNERDNQDHPGTDDVRKDNSDKIDQTGPPNNSDSSVKVEPGTENSHIMGDGSTQRGDKQNITHTGTIALGSTSTSLNSSIQEIRQVSITPAPTSYSAPIELSSSSGSTPSQPTNVANHAPQNSDIDRLIASINNTTTQGYHTIQNSLILRSTLPNHPPILSGQVTTGNIVNPRICSICQEVREFDEPFLATRLPCCPKCTLKEALLKKRGNTVFGSIKLYALKQVYEWKDYSSFQLRTMFLEQDAYLSQFTVRPFNYVCEMIRLQGHPTPYPAFQPPPLPPFLQRDARVCQNCNTVILDAFNEMKRYSCCARCLMNDALSRGYSLALLNTVKILALKQVLEGNSLEDNQFVLKFLFDRFLEQYKGKKFDYEIELLKYKTREDDNYYEIKNE